MQGSMEIGLYWSGCDGLGVLGIRNIWACFQGCGTVADEKEELNMRSNLV